MKMIIKTCKLISIVGSMIVITCLVFFRINYENEMYDYSTSSLSADAQNIKTVFLENELANDYYLTNHIYSEMQLSIDENAVNQAKEKQVLTDGENNLIFKYSHYAIIHGQTYIWPIVSEARITSEYGPRWGRLHKGVDIGVDTGTDVYAACDGTVIRAEEIGSYGKCVIISHDNGYETRYAHLSEILCSAGNRVSRAELIAKSGNTGNTTGPHLHFEVRCQDEPIDPLGLWEDISCN